MRTLLILFSALFLNAPLFAQVNDKIQEEVWRRELQYWKYVAENDTAKYRTLWHEKFLGYPDSSITDKSKIADWIPVVHSKKDLRYEFQLLQKAVNLFDDVAVVFYDVDDIYKNKRGETVSTERFKVTHTWKKFGNDWLIIGGMSASMKNQ